MGLFTLMAPPPGSAPAWFLYPEAGYDVELEASAAAGWPPPRPSNDKSRPRSA
jgi:hypothetical protein